MCMIIQKKELLPLLRWEFAYFIWPFSARTLITIKTHLECVWKKNIHRLFCFRVVAMSGKTNIHQVLPLTLRRMRRENWIPLREIEAKWSRVLIYKSHRYRSSFVTNSQSCTNQLALEGKREKHKGSLSYKSHFAAYLGKPILEMTQWGWHFFEVGAAAGMSSQFCLFTFCKPKPVSFFLTWNHNLQRMAFFSGSFAFTKFTWLCVLCRICTCCVSPGCCHSFSWHTMRVFVWILLRCATLGWCFWQMKRCPIAAGLSWKTPVKVAFRSER